MTKPSTKATEKKKKPKNSQKNNCHGGNLARETGGGGKGKCRQLKGSSVKPGTASKEGGQSHRGGRSQLDRTGGVKRKKGTAFDKKNNHAK